METAITIEKTLFREEAEEYQKEHKRTKSAGLRNGLVWTGFSIGGLVLLIIFFRLFPDAMPRILVFGFPVSAGGILYGLYGIISSLIRSTKLVTCPRCGTVHEIFKKERLYMCTDCGTLLNMGKDVESPIEFFTCPYCENQAAVSHDHGAYLCFNCGITRSSTTTAVEWETTNCSSCQEIVPQEALYCRHCGQILRPLPSYDLDWRAGKDANGHFHFARMLLATFPAKEAALAARLSSYGSRSSQWDVALGEMRVLLETLGEVQRSLEEALQEAELRSPVEHLFLEIDLLYARLLVLELKTIMWAEGPENRKLTVSPLSFFDTFKNGPQIHARKRLEQILGLVALQSAGSIGPWDDGNSIFVAPVKDGTAGELVGYSGLQAEAKRFAEWAKQSGHSADLLDTLQELQEKKLVRETEPIAPGMPLSTGEPAKPGSKFGWVLAIGGLLMLAGSLCITVPLGVQIFDPGGVQYELGEILLPIVVCVLPFPLIGFALLIIGIRKVRGQLKQPTATPINSRP